MRRPKIVAIIGSGRNVGKTLLGEQLTRLASSKGLRVWIVKHVHHGVDYRVKDTGRYLAAGASRVYAIGPSEYMLVEPVNLDPEAVVREAHGKADLLVIEGFRSIVSRLGPDITVCISLTDEICDIIVEPGFDPRTLSHQILAALGLEGRDSNVHPKDTG